jgi:hypothetical protein
MKQVVAITIEPMRSGPIYTSIRTDQAAMEANMETEAILRFLADSRRYLAR